jgi:hypothetical protein
MHHSAYGGSWMWSDPMKTHLIRCGFSLVETSNARSCELWSNGLDAVTVVFDEKDRGLYAVLEDRSMDELNLQELQNALQEPLSQTA